MRRAGESILAGEQRGETLEMQDPGKIWGELLPEDHWAHLEMFLRSMLVCVGVCTGN